MLTTSTCAGGTTQGVDLGGIKQLGKRGAELQREQSTASKPGQDTRIKMELEKKNFSDCQHQDSSGKASTHGHKEHHDRTGVHSETRSVLGSDPDHSALKAQDSRHHYSKARTVDSPITHRGLWFLLWRLLRCLSKSIWPFFKVD